MSTIETLVIISRDCDLERVVRYNSIADAEALADLINADDSHYYAETVCPNRGTEPEADWVSFRQLVGEDD